MMKRYYVKRSLPGVQAGVVEMFADNRALMFMNDGSIEPFDPKNKRHTDAVEAETKRVDAINARNRSAQDAARAAAATKVVRK